MSVPRNDNTNFLKPNISMDITINAVKKRANMKYMPTHSL